MTFENLIIPVLGVVFCPYTLLFIWSLSKHHSTEEPAY